jgi:hypothetical protein
MKAPRGIYRSETRLVECAGLPNVNGHPTVWAIQRKIEAAARRGAPFGFGDSKARRPGKEAGRNAPVHQQTPRIDIQRHDKRFSREWRGIAGVRLLRGLVH